ncbi:GNAT family N-acetyltransferase, partial [Actinoplanes sp. NPDC051633]|uniref:GNAT family N-acetyltransferase n=1 Tax=Actinoplanes sp. NPDC051633 TaxID=3155670 RepID=UPI0034444D13
MDSPIDLRTASADDWEAISRLLGHVFHDAHEELQREIEGSVFEPERGLVATDGDLVVGHAAAYSREITVPGAILPAAHVTLVGVAPTHRRRGLLTRMMRRQLTEMAEAGREPIAVLWASETKIYPRYGYGMAAQRLRADAMTRELQLTVPVPAEPAGRLRLAEPEAAIADLSKVYEQVRPERTGWSSRDDRWWRFVLADKPALRDGATELHAVVHDTDQGPTGYALWRTRSKWDRHGPDGTALIREVVAADPETYATLWRFLLSVDLTRHAEADYLAMDDPLMHMVDEPRRLGLEVRDALWVRIVDLPAALTARQYATPIDLVLDVTDPLLPANAGRWRLTGGPDGSSCTPTTDPADLACTVLELGAAYLGGPTLAALGAAGRIRELTPGALHRASAAFGWHRLPNPTE